MNEDQVVINWDYYRKGLACHPLVEGSREEAFTHYASTGSA